MIIRCGHETNGLWSIVSTTARQRRASPVWVPQASSPSLSTPLSITAPVGRNNSHDARNAINTYMLHTLVLLSNNSSYCISIELFCNITYIYMCFHQSQNLDHSDAREQLKFSVWNINIVCTSELCKQHVLELSCFIL